MLTALDRYMARLIAVPLLASLVIAAMLLVLDRMQRLFVFVATEGGPVSVVWRMLANLLPEYLGLGIPIGLMLGILLAFRRLALSSELDILRGVGLSYTRLLKVPYMYALALAILIWRLSASSSPTANMPMNACALSCDPAPSAPPSRSANSPIWAMASPSASRKARTTVVA